MVKFFKKHSIPFMVKSTLKIDDLAVYLEKNKKITDILFLGGDGSINYLINHVDISKIKQNLYLAKSGSGNDFLRSLSRIRQGEITIGEAITNQGTYKFINGCGIGIDALICKYVDSDKKKNKLSYFINFFRAVIKYHKRDYVVTVDGVEHEFRNAYFVGIQNGKYFGGGMKVAPMADITDDDYIVIAAHHLTPLTIQILFMTIYLGWHKYLKKQLTILKGNDISIRIKDEFYFETDGETIENVNQIDVRKHSSKEFRAFIKKDFKKNFRSV